MITMVLSVSPQTHTRIVCKTHDNWSCIHKERNEKWMKTLIFFKNCHLDIQHLFQWVFHWSKHLKLCFWLSSTCLNLSLYMNLAGEFVYSLQISLRNFFQRSHKSLVIKVKYFVLPFGTLSILWSSSKITKWKDFFL